VLAVCGLLAIPVARAATDLTSLSLEQLLQVSVLGASKYEQKQSEVAAAVSVITRQEIRAFGWRTLSDALASLPGIYSTYDRQYSYLGTRGFGLPKDYNTRILVTINGNRVNDTVFDQGLTGRELPIDLALVERIEFIPGPGGAVYGQNAMFGVVNLVTRDGEQINGGRLAVAAQGPQGLREARASWGRKWANGLDVVVSASALRARGEDRYYDFGQAGVAGVARGLDAERDGELFVRVTAGGWAFDALSGKRRKDDPLASVRADPLVPGQISQDQTSMMQLHYQSHSADETLFWSARLFAGRYRFVGAGTFAGEMLNFPAFGDWQGGEARLVSQAVAGHKLMLGLEIQQNTRADQNVSSASDPAAAVQLKGSSQRQGLYLQDEWQLHPAWLATLGLRLDRDSVSGSKTSPRVGLIWQASALSTVKAMLGRAHRAPNVFERDFDDGVSQFRNPNLAGETIDTLELNWDQRVGRDLTLRAAAYRWSLQGLIVQGVAPGTDAVQFQTGANVTAQGLELSADKLWPGGARLRSSVAFQKTHFADGKAALNSPRVLSKLNVSVPLPWGHWVAGYSLHHDSRRLSHNGSYLGGYAVSNLNVVTGTGGPGLELSLSLRNLFNKQFAQPAGPTDWQNALAQDGRSARAEVVYRF
jgi:outer membrane receptor protein involved in Fe transport